jgi:hypothetical protein
MPAAQHAVSVLSMAAGAQVHTMRRIQELLCMAHSTHLQIASSSDATSGACSPESPSSVCDSRSSNSLSSEGSSTAGGFSQAEEAENCSPNGQLLAGPTLTTAPDTMAKNQHANLRGSLQECSKDRGLGDAASDSGNCSSLTESDGCSARAAAAEVLPLQQQMLRIAAGAAWLAAALASLPDHPVRQGVAAARSQKSVLLELAISCLSPACQ